MSPQLKKRLVQGLGALGAASTLAYFVGVGLVFRQGFEDWARFFVPKVLLFIYIPVGLLIVYFYARVQLGRWLLAQGALEEAGRWVRGRTRAQFWLRGQREALINRVVLAQVLLRQGNYEDAEAALWPAEEPPSRARELLELARWRVEWGLRQDDLIRASEAFEEAEHLTRPRVERGALLGARAEVALRRGALGRAQQLIEEARWADPTSRRARLTEALLAARPEALGPPPARGLEHLESVLDGANTQLPGRAVELALVHATLLEQVGRGPEAEAILERAAESVDASADRRSRLLWREAHGEPVGLIVDPEEE